MKAHCAKNRGHPIEATHRVNRGSGWPDRTIIMMAIRTALGYWVTPARLAATVIGATLLTSCSGGLRQGWRAYERQDYDVAALAWEQVAARGDLRAQFLLGTMHFEGKGMPVDRASAARCFRSSAERGYAPAQNNLGLMYFQGDGVAQDRGEAAKWFQLASDQGFVKAQNNLAVMQLLGVATPRAAGETRTLLAAAAAGGDPSAQFLKGSIDGDAESQHERFDWTERAAKQGMASAQTRLAWMYLRGDGVARDDAKAAQWFRRAAEQGSVTAQANLGLMYLRGQGVPQDDAEALRWSRRAAEQGSTIAQVRVAMWPEEGSVASAPVDQE